MWALACERMEEVYRMFDHVLVNFSCGKDSTAILAVAAEVARSMGKGPVNAWWYDIEAVAPDTHDYAIRTGDRPDVDLRWLAIPLKGRNACSRKHPWWYSWHPDAEDRWVRPFPERAEGLDRGVRVMKELWGKDWTFADFADSGVLETTDPRIDYAKSGTVCKVLGIRAQESMRRRGSVLLRQKGHMNYVFQSGKLGHHAYPIYDWKTEDVWTVVKKNGLDYNRAYDAMRMSGITPSMQRVAGPYEDECLEGLWMWRICWPETWARMANRVPGARAAMEYGRSPLYGRRAPDKLFDGWKTDPGRVVDRLLGLWGPDVQIILRRHIAAMTKRHFSLSGGKSMPLKAKDSKESGIGWNLILRIAHRGDITCKIRPQYQNIGVDHVDDGSTYSDLGL